MFRMVAVSMADKRRIAVLSVQYLIFRGDLPDPDLPETI